VKCLNSSQATDLVGDRTIRGVTGETVSVPLVRVTLQSSLCSGSFLCGLATSLPSDIDMLLRNDLCPGAQAVDVVVVARSQTAALRREADLLTPLVSDPVDYVISTPDRRKTKTKQVCHVNLLKPYHEREPGLRQ